MSRMNWDKPKRDTQISRYGTSNLRGDDADQWLASPAAARADKTNRVQQRLYLKALADIHDLLKRRETFAWRRRMIEQSVQRLKAAGVL